MAELIIVEKSELVNITDTIRAKTDTTDTLALSEMPQMITDIQTGTDTSAVTATPADVLSPKVFVDSEGIERIGTIPAKTSSDLTASGATVSVPTGYYASTASKSVTETTQATPSILVSSAGLITTSATQSAGYVTAGTKSTTEQLVVQAATTIIPTDSEQVAVASGRYTTGAVTVAAIPSSYTQLNFTVVGGTSQPSSPATNTIWVNTSTSISSWIFSATQPTSPSTGMVWFQTGISATAAFNTLGKNNITVYPNACKQYVNGAWVSKTAKTYQSGAWVDWSIHLYSYGVYGAEFVNSGWNSFNLTDSADSVTLRNTVTYNASAYWRVNQLINFSAYKTVTITHGETASHEWTRPVLQVVSAAGSVLASANLTSNNGSVETISLDISAINSAGYVQIVPRYLNSYSGSAYFDFTMKELVVK